MGVLKSQLDQKINIVYMKQEFAYLLSPNLIDRFMIYCADNCQGSRIVASWKKIIYMGRIESSDLITEEGSLKFPHIPPPFPRPIKQENLLDKNAKNSYNLLQSIYIKKSEKSLKMSLLKDTVTYIKSKK